MVKGNNITHLVTNPEKIKTINELQDPPALLLKLLKIYFNTVGKLFTKASTQLALNLFSSPLHRAKHSRTDELLESAERSFIKAENYKIRVYKWGSGSKKILLLHGWQSRGTALRSFVPGLIDKGYEVYAIDAPAHGESSGRICSVRLYAEAVDAFIKIHPDVSSVISHSIGSVTWMYYNGFINQEKGIDRLIMLAAPDSFDNIVANAIQMFGLRGKLKEQFLKAVFEHFKIEDSKEISLEGKLGQLNIGEIHIFHDTEDQLIPMDRATYILDHFENAQLYTTQGFGHFRLVKNPVVMEKVQSLVR